MKILYIDEKYEYGKPELGLSATYCNYCQSLAKMGHEVIFFPVDVLTKEKSLEETNKDLLGLIQKEKPDIAFFWVGLSIFKKETLKEIKEKTGTVSVTWSFDDHWGFYKYSKHSACLFDWVFTSDPMAIKKYQKIGQKNAVFLPQGFNHFLFRPLDLPKIYDVAFVGRPHGDRKEVVKKIQEAGIKIDCFGEGWPTGRISDDEMIKVFSQSKINLNFSESSGVLWKELASIFLRRRFDRKIMINSPLKWKENFQVLLAQRRKQLKGRMFKVMGCGGFFLTNPTEGLENLYEIGEEIVYFYNLKDLIKKIKYYLSHEKEREQIARAGLERSLRDHTCEKRFDQIFKIIKENNKKTWTN